MRQWLGHVFNQLPARLRNDLLDDPHFHICEYEHGIASPVPIGMPGKGRPARSVAIRRSVLKRSPAFIGWLIAHELAHACLHNRGRHPGEDPEVAADALAASWGFPRPPR